MRTRLPVLATVAISVLLAASIAAAQPGTAERIGERIDKGLERISERVQQTWRDMRQTIDQLGVQGRVYARLRWDNALTDSEIDVDIQEPNTIILTGRAPDEASRAKAVQLARDTIGVQQVIDRLQLEPTPINSQVESPPPNPAPGTN